MKKGKMKDLLVVISFVIVSSFFSIFFKLNFLYTTLLFFGLPSVYLIYRKPSNFKKVFIASVILGIIWSFGFDYVAELNNAWNWATNTSLVFPIKFFGVVSLDIMIWFFLWVFSVIAFYEYFIDGNSPRISKRALPIAITGTILSILTVILSKTTSLLLMDYAYLKLGLMTFALFLYVVIRNPKLIKKVLIVSPYFIFLYFTFELTALTQDLWSFPGMYIGSVSIFHLSFPLEEAIVWVVMSSIIIAAYHEHSVDDSK